jgi:hypothetical protein
MLEDSPWAKTYTISRVYLTQIGTQTGDRHWENEPRIEYRVQLRSALPVRQAVVRQEMLAAKFDQMTKEQQAAFEAEAERFLAANFDDAIVVYVEYSTNTPGFLSELRRHWQYLTITTEGHTARLIPSRGESLFPARFVPSPGGGAFQLEFPRTRSGEPVIVAGDREFKVEFNHPNIGGLGEARVLVNFKVAEMSYQGRLAM